MSLAENISKDYEILEKRKLLESIENTMGKIKAILNGMELTTFFQKDEDDDVYGGDENSRVIFANLKNPDEDTPPGWEDNANFTCTSLRRTIEGEPVQVIFNLKDLKNLKVIDNEKDIMDKLIGLHDKISKKKSKK